MALTFLQKDKVDKWHDAFLKIDLQALKTPLNLYLI